MAGLILYTV